MRRLPHNVAQSMAFEGEHVDIEMLEKHLQELLDRDAR
jgi:hypothetical protein